MRKYTKIAMSEALAAGLQSNTQVECVWVCVCVCACTTGIKDEAGQRKHGNTKGGRWFVFASWIYIWGVGSACYLWIIMSAFISQPIWISCRGTYRAPVQVFRITASCITFLSTFHLLQQSVRACFSILYYNLNACYIVNIVCRSTPSLSLT